MEHKNILRKIQKGDVSIQIRWWCEIHFQIFNLAQTFLRNQGRQQSGLFILRFTQFFFRKIRLLNKKKHTYCMVLQLNT